MTLPCLQVLSQFRPAKWSSAMGSCSPTCFRVASFSFNLTADPAGPVAVPPASSGSTKLSSPVRCGYCSGPCATNAKTSGMRWADREWRSDLSHTSSPEHFEPGHSSAEPQPLNLSEPECSFPAHRFRKDIFPPQPPVRPPARSAGSSPELVPSATWLAAQAGWQSRRTHRSSPRPRSHQLGIDRRTGTDPLRETGLDLRRPRSRPQLEPPTAEFVPVPRAFEYRLPHLDSRRAYWRSRRSLALSAKATPIPPAQKNSPACCPWYCSRI